jgi:translation initiation factor 1 (eIF-1/SUI1)
MEVMIQGPQTNAVVDALEKRGIRKTFIVVEDKRK